MNINKAVKIEKKQFRLFLFFMFFLAVMLPLALVVTNLFNIFYILFLLLIEVLICFTIVIKLNGYKIQFRCINNRLIFKTGIFSKDSLIICDKVDLVHTNNCDYDLEIVIITNVKFRNKRLREVDNNLFKKYPQIKKYYTKLQDNNPEKKYFFQVVKRGGLKKFLLLDIIYRNCVKAIYTNESIQNIKIARGQMVD